MNCDTWRRSNWLPNSPAKPFNRLPWCMKRGCVWAGTLNQHGKIVATFFGAAAEAMRRLLVDSARRKQTAKHGGHLERVDLDSVELPLPMADDQLLALDDALSRLATVDTQAAEVIKLCFFLGLTHEQAATEMDISLSTGGASLVFRPFLALPRNGESAQS